MIRYRKSKLSEYQSSKRSYRLHESDMIAYLDTHGGFDLPGEEDDYPTPYVPNGELWEVETYYDIRPIDPPEYNEYGEDYRWSAASQLEKKYYLISEQASDDEIIDQVIADGWIKGEDRNDIYIDHYQDALSTWMFINTISDDKPLLALGKR